MENGELTYPVFVKPESGSASLDIHMAQDQETVEFLCGREDGLMIQEFMNGQEYGADVYIDMLSGEVVSIFVKKKLKMRAGETDKAESFQEEKLFALITDFVKKWAFAVLSISICLKSTETGTFPRLIRDLAVVIPMHGPVACACRK